MKPKIIEYDLCGDEKNYQNLFDLIKKFHYYAQVTKSTWIVKTDLSCEDVRNKLMSVLNKDDRLFVATLTGGAAWHKLLSSNDSIKEILN